jgi:phage tail tape-measure protein
MQVLPLPELAKAGDTTNESVNLLLAMLEAQASHCVSLLSSCMLSFKVGFYKRTAAELAEAEPVVAALVATGRERRGIITAHMQQVAQASGCVPDEVQDELQRLAASGHIYLEGTGELAVALRLAERPEDSTCLCRELHACLSGMEHTIVSLALS